MAQRLMSDPDADGWERSDFPIVCESCLGPNPYVRMQRIEFGGQCHISGRPYTVFRWRPGNDARYKKTIICQEVAKAKNVCQVCLLDLDYNLPVQVRDTALGISNEDTPQSDVGKEYQLNEAIKAGTTDSSFSEQRPNDLLQRLQRTTPYYKRNQAKVCSFFVRGECNRGAECPYRHEMPLSGELSEQNIKDRYYGINDPVAKKMLRRVDEMPKLEPPEDKSITTLYVGGVTPEVTEADLRDAFYSFGEIASMRKVDTRFCAFITFTTRASAERAATEMHNKLIIKGARLRLLWGRPQAERLPPKERDPMQPVATGGAAGGSAGYYGMAPLVGPAGGSAAYPSMAADAMGSSHAAAKRGSAQAAGDEAGGTKRARPAAPAGGAMQQQQQQQPAGAMAPPPPRGGMGFGHPAAYPQQMPMWGMPPPGMPMPPPGMMMMPPGMHPPGMAPPGMAPMMRPPVPGGPRPPPGALPAAAPVARAAPPSAAPPQQAPTA